MERKQAPGGLRGGRALPPLPESFMFGVATSAHQVEAYDPQREDIRDVWERERGLTRRGRATDFGERYEEDIGLARDMGCTAFRFSIAWSRVEPSPGHFDNEVFEYYGRLVAAIRDAGMEPILTLHHFSWPVHVEERGGMTADDFPAMFAHYTAEVVDRLGAEVRYWVTFNEPNMLMYQAMKALRKVRYTGAVMPDHIPQLAGDDGFRRAGLAYCIAYMRALLRRANEEVG